MKKIPVFSILFLFELLLNFILRFKALVMDIYTPAREKRLSRFVIAHTIVKVNTIAQKAKAWMYSMFSRWHVDPSTYGLAY